MEARFVKCLKSTAGNGHLMYVWKHAKHDIWFGITTGPHTTGEFTRLSDDFGPDWDEVEPVSGAVEKFEPVAIESFQRTFHLDRYLAERRTR